MPAFRDRIREFCTPLFTIARRHLRRGGCFAVYLNDPSAGRIDELIWERKKKKEKIKKLK